MSPERAWARAAAVQRLCAGLPLTPLAPHVFGFSEPSEPTRPSRRSWRNLLNLLPISFCFFFFWGGGGGKGEGVTVAGILGRLEPVSLASRERMACEHVLASARKGDAEGLLKAGFLTVPVILPSRRSMPTGQCRCRTGI